MGWSGLLLSQEDVLVLPEQLYHRSVMETPVIWQTVQTYRSALQKQSEQQFWDTYRNATFLQCTDVILISGQVDISLHNKNDQYPLQLKPHKVTHSAISEVFWSILGLHKCVLLFFPSNCQLSLPLYGRLPARPAHPSPVCEVWPDLNTPQLPRMQTLSSTTLPQENNAMWVCTDACV